jgi:5,10-methylenetetrahydrofolate reductase
LTEWIRNRQSAHDQFTVFVGASSGKQELKVNLAEAYGLGRKHNDRLVFGGVVIPERHMKYEDEHLRIAGKINHGCQFFVSQATYNVEATKNFLSDYYYYCKANEAEMVPILINLAPCGSQKTIEFMKWLGISIPKWLENDLLHSNDILDKSVSVSRVIFEELLDFAMDKGIPLGCSVESVSTRKVEIDASIQLLKEIQAIIRKRMM